MLLIYSILFFKQKTAYEMRISDWSSDVCSSDLFEAIAVERADAAEIPIIRVARDADMPHLGMRDAVNQLPSDHRAAADPGPDGQVERRAAPPPRAPAIFGKRGAADVGIDRDRTAERARKGRRHRRAAPAGLGGPRDSAPGRRARIEVEWAEGGDADRGIITADRTEPVDRGPPGPEDGRAPGGESVGTE